MRRVREISNAEAGFHMEPLGGFIVPRRAPVQPEPVGTLILLAFRVAGYDRDCDGSALSRLEHLHTDLTPSGLDVDHLGLYPETGLVVEEEELRALFAGNVEGMRR